MKLMQKLAMAGVALAFGCVAYGQAQVMRITVPFQFYAGSKVLPAGEYEVRNEIAFGRVTMSARDGSDACFLPVMTKASRTVSDNGSLVFRVYGDTYFLQQVYHRGRTDGIQLTRSSEEQRAARLNSEREVALLVR